MKALKNSILITFFLFLVLTGCQKVLEFSDNEIQPMLVVNCVISPDSAVTIDLTRSISALENLSTFPLVKDATISLSDGSTTYNDFTFISEMDSTINYNYLSGIPTYTKYEKGWYKNRQIKVTPDKQYALKISAEGYKAIEAQTAIPAPVGIDKIDTFSTTNMEQSMVTIQNKLKLVFTDPAQQSNFYRLKIEEANLTITYDSETDKTNVVPYYGQLYINSEDPIFGNDSDAGILGSGSNNLNAVFNDLLINGKTYSIELIYATDYLNMYSGNSTNEFEGDTYFNYSFKIYKVELISLSEPYFNYLNTSALQESSGNDPFSDPVLVYTNIENGTGIFGASSTSYKYLWKNTIPEKYMGYLPTTEPEELFEYIKHESSEYNKKNQYGYSAKQ
jgi:hypothetical protein